MKKLITFAMGVLLLMQACSMSPEEKAAKAVRDAFGSLAMPDYEALTSMISLDSLEEFSPEEIKAWAGYFAGVADTSFRLEQPPVVAVDSVTGRMCYTISGKVADGTHVSERGWLSADSLGNYRLDIFATAGDSNSGNVKKALLPAMLYATTRVLADRNLADYQYRMSDYCFRGEFEPRDSVAFTAWTLKAAANGNVDAMYNAAWAYYNAYGIDRDYTKAMDWWEKAGEKGDIRSKVISADGYINGQGRPKDLKKGYAIILEGVEQDDPYAIGLLGYAYSNGKYGLSRNQTMADSLYEKAARHGEGWCAYNMGIRAERHGKYAEALEWMEKGAESEDIGCLSIVGYYYKKGYGKAARLSMEERDKIDKEYGKKYSEIFKRNWGYGSPRLPK